jgi:hypothetical protein
MTVRIARSHGVLRWHRCSRILARMSSFIAFRPCSYVVISLAILFLPGFDTFAVGCLVSRDFHLFNGWISWKPTALLAAGFAVPAFAITAPSEVGVHVGRLTGWKTGPESSSSLNLDLSKRSRPAGPVSPVNLAFLMRRWVIERTFSSSFSTSRDSCSQV